MDDYGNASAGTAAPQPQQYYCRSVSPPSRVSSSCSPPPPPPPPAVLQVVGNVPPPTVVLSPCAACKILRRRCADGCVLAPYFPPTEPAKFTTAHRVFGASNIIKLLQVCTCGDTGRSGSVPARAATMLAVLTCVCMYIYKRCRICRRARARTR
jgi:hypothetical protein